MRQLLKKKNIKNGCKEYNFIIYLTIRLNKKENKTQNFIISKDKESDINKKDERLNCLSEYLQQDLILSLTFFCQFFNIFFYYY